MRARHLVTFFACLASGTLFGLSAFAQNAGGTTTHAYADAAARMVFDGVATAPGWIARDGAGLERLCTPSDDIRIGLGLDRLDAAETALCRKAGRNSVFQRRVGTLIVVPVARSGFAGALTSTALHQALASESPEGDPNRRMRWKDVDPSLPDAPIRVLLPPAGSPEATVLVETALLKGCLATRGTQLPASAAARRATCNQMRTDGAAVQATAGMSVAAWLETAGPGAIALVGYGRLAAEPALRGIIPLDGAIPTAAARGRSDYTAAAPIYFVATFKGRTRGDLRDPAVILADAALSEAVMGPEGRAAKAGLAPLAADERVGLRRDFASFLARGGIWD